MRTRSQRLVGFLLAIAVLSSPLASAQGAAEEPEYSRRGADQCLGCHDDQLTASLFWTKHAQRADDRTPFAEGQLQCEACHGPGGEHAGRVRRGEERPSMPFWGNASTASASEHNDQCLTCHESHVALNWAGSTHQVEELNCGDCHNLHAKSDPVLKTNLQSRVCYDCHVAQKADQNKPYGHPIEEKRMACTACHSPHGSSADYLLVRNSTNETCYSCHQDKRGPLLWEHAPVAEDCSNCHLPHGSIHPSLLTKRPPLLCQQCHSQAGHPSVPYTSAGLADGAPNQNLLNGSCLNCHSQVHGSNHPSGANFMR